MENNDTLNNNSGGLSGDLGKRRNRIGFAVVFVAVVFGFVAGGVGGVLGVIYAPKIAFVKKFLPQNEVLGTSSQKVVLEEDSSVIEVAKKAGPAVVSIVISKDLNKIPGYGFNPFEFDPFSPFFGFQQQPRSTEPNVQQVGAGSGFFVSSDGLIITNKHVVSDEQATYSVITNDGKTYDAVVLTRDPINDLAVVKVNVSNAPTLELSDVSTIVVGQRVIAIGNSLGQYQNTVTTGVVSGIGRSIVAGGGSEGSEQLDGVIQTDAAINPGNSGGPLLNSLGQVIGINTAVDRQGQLVGFAIPASDAQRALESYKKNGKITRPFLGVRYVLISEEMAKAQKLPKNFGALVLRGQNPTDLAVIPGGPADKAGIVENDIILSVNGVNVDKDNSLLKLLKKHGSGDVLELTVYHRGEEKKVKVTLEDMK
jgi:serine protease Do